jgi:hypothetical protein
VWELPLDERAMKMKELTLAALSRHKEKDRECCLNFETDLHVLLRLDQFWFFLWHQGRSLVLDKMAAQQKHSGERSKIVKKAKVDRLLENNWSVGDDFSHRNQKYKAVTKVYDELLHCSYKSTAKLYSILSRVITKLRKSIISDLIEFDECNLLSPGCQKRIKTMNEIVNTAKFCIKSMKGRISKDKFLRHINFQLVVPGLCIQDFDLVGV